MRITRQQGLGIVASLLLLSGVFGPLLSVPLLGDLNLFELRNLSGLLDYSLTGIAYGISGLALASLVLTFMNYCRGLLITGLFSSATLVLIFFQLNEINTNLHENASAGLIMTMTGATVDYSNLKYGSVLLIAGTLLLIIASFFKSRR